MSDPTTPTSTSKSAAESVELEPKSEVSTPFTSPPPVGGHGKDGSQGEDDNNVSKIAHSTIGANGKEGGEDEEEDEEDMDYKSRALANLLKTSSVFVAIMADKMKEQQRRSQEEAARRMQNKRKKQDLEKAPTRRSARTATAAAPATEEEKNLPTRGRGRPPRKKAREEGEGQDDAGAKKNKTSIMDYMKKTDVDLGQKPSVQEALAEAADEYEGEQIGAHQDLVATEQPSLITGGKMKQYQLQGLEWLKSLWMNGLCGILADEMGLGKTLQAISMIAFFKDNNISGPFLVAAPLSTIRNWIEEFKFWCPKIETVLYHGGKEEREALRKKRMGMKDQAAFDFPVVVTSYEICMNDRKYLAGYQWRYIIVDEGHRLKNMNCRLIKELMTYNSANRLLLTGTPLQNNITELWSLLHFLLPEVFNDLDSFERWFDFSSVLDEKEGADGKNVKATKRKNNLVATMHAILKPFLLRRVKSDVESSLPKKREYILYAPLTSEQKELYREILAGTSRAYLEGKAAERIESRSASLKRKANGSGRSTPAKSLKPTRDSTPASVASAGSARRSRRGKVSYRDITDGEFSAKLRRIEAGQHEDVNSPGAAGTSELDDDEAYAEFERAQTLKLAKKEIANKKLQNPVMQARLVCNSPHNFYWPFGPSTPEEEASGDYPHVHESLVRASGKLMLLDTLLKRLFALGHKVLIFSQFKTTLDIIETYATELRGWHRCCRIDGSISQDERYEQITAFNRDPKYQLFLLSTRAGGQGINLTAADTVILFDSDWNPQQDLQAMDRAHRIGQTKPVIVYRLATRGTVEETLLLRADGKRKLEKLVIQKGKFKSLLDGGEGKNEMQDTFLNEDEFEKYDVAAADSANTTTAATTATLLTDAELDILTDRSDKAYERAESGLDVGGQGKAFQVAETKRNGGSNVLEDLTTK
ncbi:hypothetical protein DV737_g4940, partial [Chaetothyriales sp. CBS 132003]